MITNEGAMMKLFVGVDVSKNNLDVYINGNNISVLNNQKGFEKIYSALQKEVKRGNEMGLILCEPTGGYEAKMVKFMQEINMPIHVAHANKIRSFAKAKGILAKTDRIDAGVIAQYGETMKPEPDKRLHTAEEEFLGELMKRREQLIGDKIRESNRLEKEQSSSVTKSIKSHIKWLEKEIGKTEKEVNKLRENKELNAKIELLKSVPAIGDVAAESLIAFLPELGLQDEKRIVALVGLAPFNRDSGQCRGKRCIQGGRANVRRLLYMSALCAVRYYREMKESYVRLRNKGKLPKVALIAVARKLLIVLNSVMSRKTNWVLK
jgi:transposase